MLTISKHADRDAAFDVHIIVYYRSCVLFAIDDGETNIYDSRITEFFLWTK